MSPPTTGAGNAGTVDELNERANAIITGLHESARENDDPFGVLSALERIPQLLEQVARDVGEEKIDELPKEVGNAFVVSRRRAVEGNVMTEEQAKALESIYRIYEQSIVVDDVATALAAVTAVDDFFQSLSPGAVGLTCEVGTPTAVIREMTKKHGGNVRGVFVEQYGERPHDTEVCAVLSSAFFEARSQ